MCVIKTENKKFINRPLMNTVHIPNPKLKTKLKWQQNISYKVVSFFFLLLVERGFRKNKG